MVWGYSCLDLFDFIKKKKKDIWGGLQMRGRERYGVDQKVEKWSHKLF